VAEGHGEGEVWGGGVFDFCFENSAFWHLLKRFVLTENRQVKCNISLKSLLNND